MPKASSSGYSRTALFWSFACGVIVALMIAAATALWVTSAPIPFVSKVQQASSNVDPSMLDGSVDPNKKLYADGQNTDQINAQNVATVTTSQDAAPAEIDTGRLWVQAGAFSQREDAEGMRARIAFIGLDAQVFYKNEGGQRLYRVRIGPFDTNDQAEEIMQALADSGIQGHVVRLKN